MLSLVQYVKELSTIHVWKFMEVMDIDIFWSTCEHVANFGLFQCVVPQGLRSLKGQFNWSLAIDENIGFFCIDKSFVSVYFYVGSGAQANQGPPPHLAYCRLCDLITSPSYPQILQILRLHFPDLSETQCLPDKFIQPVGVVSWNRIVGRLWLAMKTDKNQLVWTTHWFIE